MTSQSTRPVFLKLWQIRFPITAIVSILHRISGVILFLALPGLLWLYQQTQSFEGFQALQHCLQSPVSRLFVWVILSALLYHLVAGIRHLLMDAGLGHSRAGGRRGAGLSLLIAMLLIIFVGMRLW